jgi:branched-chain amino acid transport system substrate-binding protein
LQAYQKAGFGRAASTVSALTYDATNVLTSAVASVLSAHATVDAAARTAIVQALQRTSTTGVSGPIAFDGYGDTTSRVTTIYQISGGDVIQRAMGQVSG